MRRHRFVVLLFAFAAALTMWPATAQAQARRVVRGPYVRPVVVVRGYYYDPFVYSPFWYPRYPYPYAVYPPYGPYPFGYAGAGAVRLQVTPRETEVYVDGYLAGTVDDFDGFFQRLRLPPGEHEIALYLDGHRGVRQSILLTPGTTYRIRHAMEPLGPGEANESRPAPSAVPARPSAPGPAAATPAELPGFGTLWIRVQPATAEVFIDGERWEGPAAQDGLVVQVSEGAHRVEIRQEGYRPYSADVKVRAGETTTLNVSLPVGARGVRS